MRSTPSESNPATSPRPRTTRMSSGACGSPSRRRSETASACETSPKAQPRTHTPPRYPTSVGALTLAAPTAPQEPCAPHSTMRLTPQRAAPPPNPVTKPATAAGRHTRPCPEDTKRSGSRRTPTHTPTGTSYAQRPRAQSRNRHNRLTQPKPQNESNPSNTPKPLMLDS